MHRKRRERNRNKRGRAGGSERREPGKLGRFVSEEEESDSFIEAYLEDAEFLIERSDEVELWPWEENEEECREEEAPALNSYQNRTCRRTGYREEVGRQRNAWMKGKWKWKKR